MSLATQIQCFGFDVVSFGEPEQLRDAAHNAPDAVVMDLIFPDSPSGGSETMANLASQLPSGIPVVSISSRDDLYARLWGVRAGTRAYFAKPVNVTELCSTLRALTSKEQPDPYRVLVVDDDAALADYHAVILQEAGMVTRTLNDPLLALAPLSEFKPDLILMDMYMPGFNGMELAKAIRQMEPYCGIPIVFLSSETDVDKQFDAVRMGGDEFLTKPVKPQHLVTSVAVRAERMKVIRSFLERDGMTGLYHHTASKERLSAATDAALRSGEGLSVAMIDLDNFKEINNSHGHPVGDRVLVTLARLLRQRLRKSDTVGRCGGEEFVAILPGCTAEQAVATLDELRESYAGIRFPAKGEPFGATFSCGVASLDQFRDAASLWKGADDALCAAKQHGRNRVERADGGAR